MFACGGRKGSLTRAHTVLTDVDELKMNAARLCNINKVADKKKPKKSQKRKQRAECVCVRIELGSSCGDS